MDRCDCGDHVTRKPQEAKLLTVDGVGALSLAGLDRLKSFKNLTLRPETHYGHGLEIEMLFNGKGLQVDDNWNESTRTKRYAVGNLLYDECLMQDNGALYKLNTKTLVLTKMKWYER